MDYKNWSQFAKACPILSMAAALNDWEGGSEGHDELWGLISTSTDRRFAEAEEELVKLGVWQFHAVVYADPGEELPCAPIACSVLTAMFA
jgi:hypothetical protein